MFANPSGLPGIVENCPELSRIIRIEAPVFPGKPRMSAIEDQNP